MIILIALINIIVGIFNIWTGLRVIKIPSPLYYFICLCGLIGITGGIAILITRIFA